MTLSTDQDNILEGIPLQEENATDDGRSLGLPTLRRLDNEEGIEDEEEQNEDLPTLNGGYNLMLQSTLDQKSSFSEDLAIVSENAFVLEE